MPELEETSAPTITYIPQSNRTIVVRVKKPGEEPFDLVADVYSEDELATVRARKPACLELEFG